MYALILWTWVASGGMTTGTTYFSDATACERARQVMIKNVTLFPQVNYSVQCVPTGLANLPENSDQTGPGKLPQGLVRKGDWNE